MALSFAATSVGEPTDIVKPPTRSSVIHDQTLRHSEASAGT